MEIVCQLILRRNITICRSVNQFRTIMTSPALREKVAKDADEAAGELKNNSYYEKYAQKIATLQQTSPEEFLSRIEAREKEKSKPKFGGAPDRKYSSLLQPKKQLSSPVELQDQPLSKIMKIELVHDKDASEITKIWNEYHLKKDAIVATIPSKSYEEICTKAKKYSMFVLPIPRSQGYEFIVLQFFRNTVHFTPLLHYQVHKENAPECLTITHYTEFKNSKGIVLMRGEFDKNVINTQEAQCLANQLQLYYSQNDPQRVKLLEQFTTKPDEFKHMELIKQIERFS